MVVTWAAIILLSSYPTNQHFILLNGSCYSANTCNHTWSVVCGFDVTLSDKRVFIDECHMNEFNCNYKKDYVKINLTECYECTQEQYVSTLQSTPIVETITTTSATTTTSTETTATTSAETVTITTLPQLETLTTTETTATNTTIASKTMSTTENTTETSNIEPTITETITNTTTDPITTSALTTITVEPTIKEMNTETTYPTIDNTTQVKTTISPIELTTLLETNNTTNITKPASVDTLVTNTIEQSSTIVLLPTTTNLCETTYSKDCDKPVTWETTVKGETRDFFRIIQERYGRRAKLMKDTTHWPTSTSYFKKNRRDRFIFGHHNEQKK